ncbi:MAG: type II toxin-antitoxin system RelE/ParE family toxin [Deltaproteobacteria bacterium]|jgi:toxin ParE1/3/4|nr:type II toxin-antitoxin system RelE/ParE family toxin [Deltaproteobacteria bacterium]
MSFTVHIIGDAEKDLYEIYDYVRKSSSPINAQKLFLRLEQTCMSLADNPERGHIPPELERIGVYEYREIHVKVYRIIYQIIDNDVFIHCILDGGRDLQELLEYRILR